MVVRKDNPSRRGKPTRWLKWKAVVPMTQKASQRDTTGVHDRGMCIKGQLTNLGEPPASLDMEQPEDKGYRHGTRALAMNELHLLGIEPPEKAEHKRRRQQGIGKGAKSEPT